ncbi:MAG: FAD:protein FMN transferase, partial [Eubacterium sp.]|nr:FAD:protein FMN transferase [Eubacterium sp.]
NSMDYIAKVNASDHDTVVTSGDYQRYYTVDGVDYCHIINPETLMPADFMSSVSVISKDSAYADMLSTALFNMRIEDGLSLVNGMSDTEAMWVDKNGEITYSDNFKNYVVK